MAIDKDFKLLPEYKLAIDSIIKNPVTYLSGAAGSGKSTFIRYVQSRIKNSILLAPTGIAAINISGKTAHSFFKFPAKFIVEEDIRRLDRDTQLFLRSTALIIIDEVSMVSSNLLDAIDSSLQLNLGNNKPFGGIHILLVGDLFQLPPVIGNNVDKIYYDYYDSELFFDSYCIKDIIKDDKMGYIELNKVLRQNDTTFIDILNNIRCGRDVDNTIEHLNSLVNYNDDAPNGYVQITPYKDVSELTNIKRLRQIDSQVKTYFGNISGTFNIKNCPVKQTLELKVGAQIMVTKNLSTNVVNGSVGVIKSLHDEYVVVTISEEDVKIYPSKWDEYNYVRKGDKYESTVTGSFTQIPVTLAWSLTIHKVQSATIKKLHINMDRGAFSPGMLYVALSRAVDIEGLSTSQPFYTDDVIIDPLIIDFYKTWSKS